MTDNETKPRSVVTAECKNRPENLRTLEDESEWLLYDRDDVEKRYVMADAEAVLDLKAQR